MNKILLILLSSFVLFSCNEEKTENKQVSTQKTTNEECSYSVNPEAWKFQWTAFKTTAKVGVKGTFNQIEIFNEKKESSISELILNSEFIIHLNSLNSANEERDAKIIDLFFGKMSNPSEIRGVIQDVKGNNNEGELMVLLKVNEYENPVRMKYKLEKNLLSLAGNLNLLDWKTEKSFDALNAACKDLHTGDDGVSKTWTEVAIEISTVLEKDCK